MPSPSKNQFTHYLCSGAQGDTCNDRSKSPAIVATLQATLDRDESQPDKSTAHSLAELAIIDPYFDFRVGETFFFAFEGVAER